MLEEIAIFKMYLDDELHLMFVSIEDDRRLIGVRMFGFVDHLVNAGMVANKDQHTISSSWLPLKQIALHTLTAIPLLTKYMV